jgi:hypothetical protein
VLREVGRQQGRGLPSSGKVLSALFGMVSAFTGNVVRWGQPSLRRPRPTCRVPHDDQAG